MRERERERVCKGVFVRVWEWEREKRSGPFWGRIQKAKMSHMKN